MDQAALRPCESKLGPPRCPWGNPSVPAGERLCKPNHTTSREGVLFHSQIGNVISDLTFGGRPWKLCECECWWGGGGSGPVGGTGRERRHVGERGRTPGYLRESRRPPEHPPRSPAETCGRSQEAACTGAPETQRCSSRFPRGPRGLAVPRHGRALSLETMNGQAPHEWEKPRSWLVTSSRRAYGSGNTDRRLTAGFEGSLEQDTRHHHSEHPRRLPTGLSHSLWESPLAYIPYSSPLKSIH